MTKKKSNNKATQDLLVMNWVPPILRGTIGAWRKVFGEGLFDGADESEILSLEKGEWILYTDKERAEAGEGIEARINIVEEPTS